jgi:hypothetical protein
MRILFRSTPEIGAEARMFEMNVNPNPCRSFTRNRSLYDWNNGLCPNALMHNGTWLSVFGVLAVLIVFYIVRPRVLCPFPKRSTTVTD